MRTGLVPLALALLLLFGSLFLSSSQVRAEAISFTFYSGGSNATFGLYGEGPISSGIRGDQFRRDPIVMSLNVGGANALSGFNPDWNFIPGTWWVSYFDSMSGGPQIGFVAHFYVDFYLPSGYSTPSITISALAADTVNASLNGHLLLPAPLADYRTVGTTGTSDPTLFLERSRLQFDVTELKHGDGFGLDFTATVTFELAAQCPLSHGYWKNHSGDWPVDSLTLGNRTYDRAALLALLRMPSRGDASVTLARQLIAAKLNVANGAPGSPVTAQIHAADSLLGGFVGALPYGLPPSSDAGRTMTSLSTMLDEYNNGLLTPGCGNGTSDQEPPPRKAPPVRPVGNVRLRNLGR